MTLGNKLFELRRKNNYTQEQLADLLKVSRQSISKWESDLAYPETEKLIKLGQLYGCSMDYLLREDVSIETMQSRNCFFKEFHFEKKSKRTVCGMPLWHINIGYGQTAKGIIAIGLISRGVISVGLLSFGVLSFGVFAFGIIALGCLALGLLAAGAISGGLIALGAISIGILSIGALSVGEFSVGAAAFGHYFAQGDYAHAMIAIGRTTAHGSLFQKENLHSFDFVKIKELLDQNVPWFFGWAKSLIIELIG